MVSSVPHVGRHSFSKPTLDELMQGFKEKSSVNLSQAV